MNEIATKEQELLDAVNDRTLRRCLDNLRAAVEGLWRTSVPRVVQDSAERGIEHFERLAAHASQLLSARNQRADPLSPVEMFLLVGGIYLHDIGLQCAITTEDGREIKKRAETLGATFDAEFSAPPTPTYPLAQQRAIRDNYRCLSAAWIEYAYETGRTAIGPAVLTIPFALIPDLMDLCLHHTCIPVERCPRELAGGGNGRKRLVAALLRCADELDVVSKRADIATITAFSVTPAEAIFWWLHTATEISFRPPNRFQITVGLQEADYDALAPPVRARYLEIFQAMSRDALAVLDDSGFPVFLDVEGAVRRMRFAPSPPDFIRGLLIQAHQHTSRILWNLPPPNPSFIGREDALSRIDSEIYRGPVLISGLPGMGKTQTAIEFAYRNKARYKAAFWVVAANATVLREGFLEIARLLHVPLSDDQEVIPTVLHRLKAESNWLLLLDNADELDTIKPILQAFKMQPECGHIVATTRAKATGQLGERVSLGEMSDSEGAQLMLDRSFRTGDANRARALEISRKLGGLPLAIDQAGALVEEMALTLDEYQQLFETMGVRLHSESASLSLAHHASVVVTFRLAFEQVESRNRQAAEVLRCCAFLAPDGVPEEVCKSVVGLDSGDKEDEYRWFEAVRCATSHSLISRTPDARSLKIHRLVQAVFRDALTKSEKERYAVSLLRAMRDIAGNEAKLTPATGRRILPSILHWVDVVREERALSAQYAEPLCGIANTIFYYMVERGLWREWESFYAAIRDVSGSITDEREWNRLELNRGVLYLQQRQWSEAQSALEGVLSRARTMGDGTAEAIAWLRLGDVAFFNEIPDESSECQRKRLEIAGVRYANCLAIALSASNHDPAIAAKARLCLGNVLLRQGQWGPAEQEYAGCISTFERVNDLDNKAVALRNRAIIYREQGRYEDAIRGFAESLHLVRDSGNRLDEAIILLRCLTPSYEACGKLGDALNAAQAASALLVDYSAYEDLIQEANEKCRSLQKRLGAEP